MELTFLGTGAGVPSRNRNVTSIMLKLLDESNEMWMFDCGEATQHQILKTTLKPRKVSKIFITHLHGDHIFGLPGFLSSRSHQGGDSLLTVYGPKGIKEYIQSFVRLTKTTLGYELRIIELDQEGIAFQNDQYQVIYHTLDHAIQSYGFRIVEADQTGELLIDKAREDGVPNGPLLGRLKKGLIVTLEDGRQLNGLDYIGPDKKGHIVTILGDTRYNEHAISLAKDADILVHEATFAAGEEKMARNYFHSTANQAGKVAATAGVKKLLITHISARYVGKAAGQLELDAQKVFENTQIVKDFDSVAID
ncbi:ribonuclease Z [Aerococcus sp. 1KP-2016]|uniref:ribonuclease Z n=1 Tax=Aerococcus sp. 1KP-2016 TaxID=1981982 RepID=UPI000B997803|nr:ribonuclease Z [Aerococcus sp. 1KP-2016]OYQ66755.1 ribonuclease Z [Aerococcus sp. 1KP-2016]